MFGYGIMWLTLEPTHGFHVRGKAVIRMFHHLNPLRTLCRAHRFVRGAYFSIGPHDVWHVDRFDKLMLWL